MTDQKAQINREALSHLIASYGGRQDNWPKKKFSGTLSDMLQAPEISEQLQKAQILDAALDEMSFSASPHLQQRIIGLTKLDIIRPLMISQTAQHKYAGYALIGMAACLLIGVFAMPMAHGFLDFADTALTGETLDLFKVSFETWKI